MICHVDWRRLRGRSLHIYAQPSVLLQLESRRRRYRSRIAHVAVRADQSHHHAITFHGGVPHLPAPTNSTAVKAVLTFVPRDAIALAIHDESRLADAIPDATEGRTEVRIIVRFVSWRLAFVAIGLGYLQFCQVYA